MGFSSENGISFSGAPKCLRVISFPWCFPWWESSGLSVSLQFPSSEWGVPIKLQSLLVRCVTGPDCPLKVNWHISARDPLITADLPTVRAHCNTAIPSTAQKGSLNTSVGSLKRVGRPDCKPSLLDSSYFPRVLHLQGGKDREKITQMGACDFPLV